MKKYLLPPLDTYYKAALHTHSTVSDGVMTPQEVRDTYRAAGFSILALTDHSVLVPHPELNTEDFLMLTGVEIDMTDSMLPPDQVRKRQRHLCLIAKDPSLRWIPFRDTAAKASSIPYEALDEIDTMSADYTPEAINAVIAECNRRGYLVTYNHPAWSLESYPDYAPMKGLWGMEYQNAGSLAIGFDENNGRVYHDLLMLGNRIMPVFAEDMHRPVRTNGVKVLNTAWTMIGAEKLEYASVIEAMERGDLYASSGPEITELSLEGETLTVRCSPCARIQITSQTRWADHRVAGETLLTHAEFDLSRWFARSKNMDPAFIRLILTAPDGTYAVTRAYWMDEL